MINCWICKLFYPCLTKSKEKLAIFIDMENPGLIVLIIIAGAIYKIYQGYKEEQEKAKKRMEQLKKQVQTKDSYQNPIPPVAKPLPHPVKNTPKPTLVFQKKFENVTDIPVFDEVEIVRQRKLEQKRLAADQRLKQEKSKYEHVPIQIEEFDAHDFDLRKAIIQQAVLERPYKD